MATRVPKKDSEFDPYIRNTTTVLETGIPLGAVRLGLTVGQGTQWLGFRDQWIAVYPKYTNSATRTTTITNAKNTIKKEFTLFAEKPLKLIEASDNLTADDRGTFKLPERDRTKTSRGAIADAPFGTIKGTGGGMMEVRVRRANDATRSSMHPLADAVEFKYLILDNSNGTQNPPPPMPTPQPVGKDLNKAPTPDDCPLAVTSKTALWRINLGTQNQAKRIVGFLRWVNLTNPANNSGWSDLMTTIIS